MGGGGLSSHMWLERPLICSNTPPATCVTWSMATSARSHATQPLQQPGSPMAATPTVTSWVPRATNTTAAATQPPSMVMLYQFLPAWGR